MNIRESFERIMSEQSNMALATVTSDGVPDVRVVNFCWRADTGRVYFSTFPDNDKVREIEADPHVAFTTVPAAGNAHVRGKGVCRRSALTISEIAGDFIRKVPAYRGTVERFGDQLVLFEIEFHEASVTIDLAHSGTLKL
ncbi:pyridoxamine 5'-phosphate oxidase family protein [Bifidobacterium scaligerum]|uniref:Pyridoxamine 5-phosphate oxidase n=1 Tax=Bifidobacterium scaligerum TaxID=2052656 RepID=A0A2M9HSL7_9BIFI|nr:pyridoxamine 5'-phosphate oxidase family protein [Bifidobacterium scaligerum]PJM79811.1 pyridoxamine 5-phosphate oxidase [Bifidobacterium scaligerum]